MVFYWTDYLFIRWESREKWSISSSYRLSTQLESQLSQSIVIIHSISNMIQFIEDSHPRTLSSKNRLSSVAFANWRISARLSEWYSFDYGKSDGWVWMHIVITDPRLDNEHRRNIGLHATWAETNHPITVTIFNSWNTIHTLQCYDLKSLLVYCDAKYNQLQYSDSHSRYHGKLRNEVHDCISHFQIGFKILGGLISRLAKEPLRKFLIHKLCPEVRYIFQPYLTLYLI